MKYLITYDIEDNKRRKKISDELEAYGLRVNFSVFECELSQTNKNKLLLKLNQIVNKKQDSIRFYAICHNCLAKCFELCDKIDTFEEHKLFL